MFFAKHRFEVWSLAQHPLKHTLSDFAYSNPALPGTSDVNSALNWVFKVLYPNDKAAVANPAALPLLGNTLNDYRVVTDDGDGKPAGYRWEQREGEVSASWHKVFDFDWSTDSILAAYLNITQDLYVYKNGKSDLDAAGAVVTGLYAGQTVNGGNVASQNLTLRANSGDGVGAHTGFVQVDDHFRPTLNNTYDAGTSALKFRTGYFGTSAIVSTLTLSSGSIVDSGGTINFGSNILTTTGNITGAIVTGSTSLKTGTMTIIGGSITDTSLAITFGSSNLTTSGTITAATGSVLANFTFTTGSIVSASATITFGSNNLLTTGTLTAGNASFTRTDTDNIRIDGNTISVLNSNGNLIVQANGTGVIDLQNSVTSLGITATGTVTVNGILNAGNLRLTVNTLLSTNVNGNITLSPNGTGGVFTTANFSPSTDASFSVGSASNRFNNIYLSNGVSDGTSTILMTDLLSLKNINVGVSAGMTLFYNAGSGYWEPSLPDTEIVHSSLSGLTTGDAGHTQFVMLTGRAGGQTVQGGTAASENLTLESTSNATKGTVFTKNNFKPFADAVFSAGWTGVDLGGSTRNYNDLYMKGQAHGLRVENFTTAGLPSASSQNIGRVVFDTDVNVLYIDTGATLKTVGLNTFRSDTSWDGSTTTKDVTVSSTISDARKCLWQLCDNTNDYERIYTVIKPISASVVRIIVNPALPAGSYRLLGVETT